MSDDLISSIDNTTVRLHLLWKVYRQLFAQSEARVELLNETGSLVFHFLQQLCLDEVTLELCRLTDHAKVGGRHTAGIRTFLDEVRLTGPTDLADRLEARWTDLRAKTSKFRIRRSKAIAHSDLDVRTGSVTPGVPGLSREDVEVALESLRDLLNEYRTATGNGVMVYEMSLPPLGTDGDFLVENLKYGHLFRELKLGRLDSPDDVPGRGWWNRLLTLSRFSDA